jgi:general secretion pathway protein A
VPVPAAPAAAPAPAEKPAAPVAPAPAAAAAPAATIAENDAFRGLFDLWGVPWRPAAGNLCAQSLAHGLVCFRGGGGLAQLRRLDRPAVLTVSGAQGSPRFALLAGLDGERALLAAGGGRREESASALRARMTGEFTLLWRMPAAGSAVIAPGDRGPAVAWLLQRLERAGAGPPPAGGDEAVYGPETAAAVRRFQAVSGIPVDGVAGPETLILLDAEPGPGTPTLRGAP